MKKFALLCALICAAITSLSAQPQQGKPRRGNIHKFQVQLLIKQLEIEESKQPQFEAIYTEYTSQLDALRPRRKPTNTNELTDEIIEQQILSSFETAEKTTQLKREYYSRFKSIISPRKILKMYKIERRLNERLHSEIEDRAKGKGHAKNATDRTK